MAGDLSGFNTGGYADVESVVGPAIGQVEVYKVNHHASRYSSNPTFLASIAPKIGIVSVGPSNGFGHPTAEAMSRLHAANILTYWTSSGRGVLPDPSRDFVAGDIVIDVPPNAASFAVGAAGQIHVYALWGAVPQTAPGPPRGLTTSVNGTTASFNWLAPLTGGAVTHYVLEASLSPGGPLLTSIPISIGTTLGVANVPNGVYHVRVRAANAQGLSTPSNEVVVLVGAGGCATPPDQPQGFNVSASGSTVALNWSSPVSGCAPTSYVVQAGSSPGLSNITVVKCRRRDERDGGCAGRDVISSGWWR